MDNIMLLVILGINIFVFGVVTALALQFAHASHNEKKTLSQLPADQPALPPQIKQHIIQNAKTKFTNTLNSSAHGLERELDDTSTELRHLVKRFGTEILDGEMKLFRKHLEDIRESTEKSVRGADAAVAQKQANLEAELTKRQTEFEAQLRNLQTDLEGTLLNRNKELDQSLLKKRQKLEEKMNAELDSERQRLLKQIDDRLADAVTSFLADTLGHNVDLGTQAEYLVHMLELHKDEFKKEVAYEDNTSA